MRGLPAPSCWRSRSWRALGIGAATLAAVSAERTLRPGPGVGGHCIAIDPSYLSWKVGERLGFGIDFIEHAKVANKRMPGHVAARIGEALNEAGKPVKGSSILVLGVAYKPGVNDVRESPSLAVVERLARLGAAIA